MWTTSHTVFFFHCSRPPYNVICNARVDKHTIHPAGRISIVHPPDAAHTTAESRNQQAKNVRKIGVRAIYVRHILHVGWTKRSDRKINSRSRCHNQNHAKLGRTNSAQWEQKNNDRVCYLKYYTFGRSLTLVLCANIAVWCQCFFLKYELQIGCDIIGSVNSILLVEMTDGCSIRSNYGFPRSGLG